jgi:acetyltransferase-like isoleucine patch superfamily enzyme
MFLKLSQYFRIRKGIERRLRVVLARLRVLKYRLSGASIGRGCSFGEKISFIYGWRTGFGNACMIDAFSQFKCPTSVNPDNVFNIDIRDNVFIGRGTIIDSNFSIKIGNGTFIAPYCFITDTNHKYVDISIPIRLQGYEYKSVEIGEDVWVGAHVVIVAGVKIGNGSIVAANSTVIKDVPENVVVGGSPAKIIKQRKSFTKINIDNDE